MRLVSDLDLKPLLSKEAHKVNMKCMGFIGDLSVFSAP